VFRLIIIIIIIIITCYLLLRITRSTVSVYDKRIKSVFFFGYFYLWGKTAIIHSQTVHLTGLTPRPS